MMMIDAGRLNSWVHIMVVRLAPPKTKTLADLIRELGGISPKRIRMDPPPGKATVKDVEANKCCELLDGTLVEKAMGYPESILAAALIEMLRRFVRPRRLGIITGPDGTLELFPNLVRLPDVAFISWKRLPGRKVPKEAVPALAPDLAVEVLSKGNTRREMARKRKEYFEAGVRLVWIVDHVKRTVTVYTSATELTILTDAHTLDGGDVLPEFSVPVKDIFVELDEEG